MGTPCLANIWESKRGNEHRVETKEVKGCSIKMVRKAHNQEGSRRPKRKCVILVAYPEPYNVWGPRLVGRSLGDVCDS